MHGWTIGYTVQPHESDFTVAISLFKNSYYYKSVWSTLTHLGDVTNAT